MAEGERETEENVVPPRPPVPPAPGAPDDETVRIEWVAGYPALAPTAGDETVAIPQVAGDAASTTGDETVAIPQVAGDAASAMPIETPAAPAAEPEATTLPIPIAGPDQTAQLSPVAPPARPAPPAARKKRRGVRALVWSLAVVVVLAVGGVAGWFVAEGRAEQDVTKSVQEQTAKALGISDPGAVQVQFAKPVLPQVIAGSLSTLDITVPNAPLGGATGTVTLHATGVPTRGSGTAASAKASVALTPESLKSLAGAQKDIVPGSVRVQGSDISVDLNPAQFLSGVSFKLTLAPSVAKGALVLTPTSFDVAGFNMSADLVRQRFGGLAAGILEPRTICVASHFPKGMTLTGIHVSPTAVVTDFEVDPRMATDPGLQAKGACG